MPFVKVDRVRAVYIVHVWNKAYSRMCDMNFSGDCSSLFKNALVSCAWTDWYFHIVLAWKCSLKMRRCLLHHWPYGISEKMYPKSMLTCAYESSAMATGEQSSNVQFQQHWHPWSVWVVRRSFFKKFLCRFQGVEDYDTLSEHFEWEYIACKVPSIGLLCLIPARKQ